MKALKAWSENRPLLLSAFATQMAFNAEKIVLSMQDIKQAQLPGGQRVAPSLPDWFSLYRSHKRVFGFVGEVLKGLSSLGPFVEDVFDRKLSKDVDFVKRANELCEPNIEAIYKDIEEELTVDPFDAERQDIADALFAKNRLSMSFLCLVYIPCITLYRCHPARLYRKARQGDAGAIEKLLRLDGLMIHDPMIGKRIQEYRFRGRIRKYEELMSAPLKSPKAKVSHLRTKMIFAGMISAVSHLLKTPLTEPEIRELFDAVAKDSGKGDIDSDIPASPESFAKAIQRERKIWLANIQPDSKF